MKSMKHQGLIIVALVFSLAVTVAIATASDSASGEAVAKLEPAKGDKDGKKQKSYDEHIEDMNDAFRKALYAQALSSCKKAYKLKASPDLATKCGVAACRAKRRSDAKRFHAKSNASGKNAIKQMCLKSGIQIAE